MFFGWEQRDLLWKLLPIHIRLLLSIFQSFGSKTAIRIRKLSNPIAYGLALSPDERELTYTQSDAHGSDLQIVRNIR